MTQNLTFAKRNLRICYLNTQPKIIAVDKVTLEKKLQQLCDVEIHTIKGLDDPQFTPCDLLVVTAEGIDEDQFVKWLRGFSRRIEAQGHIWVPAIIFAQIPFMNLSHFLDEAHQMNWYFDILDPDHLSSLPMRVANLLRIHDHLHELRRYQEQLNLLDEKMNEMKQSLARLKV